MRTIRWLQWSIPALCAFAGVAVVYLLYHPMGAEANTVTWTVMKDTLASGKQGTEILWGAQFGTDKCDGASWIVADAEDNLYIAGHTRGALTGANAGEEDVFVMKIDREGNRVWVKQWGSDKMDLCLGLGIAPAGNVYVAGTTNGDLFAPNLDPARIVRDIFVVKLAPDGNVLWQKQMGTDDDDSLYAMGVDGQGNVVLAGTTQGNWFATNPMRIHFNPFILKLRHDGELLWGKQFVGRMFKMYQIWADAQGNFYAAGKSTSLDIPLFGGTRERSPDGFLAKFSPEGELIWSTLMGTSEYDRATTLGAGAGTFYVMGSQRLGEVIEDQDVFLARLDGDGRLLWYRVIVPRGEKPSPGEILVDAQGNAILLGDTGGSFDKDEVPSAGEGEAWIVQLDGAGNTVRTWSWGSASWDTISAAVWSRREPGVFYVVGGTLGDFYATNAGELDIFVVRNCVARDHCLLAPAEAGFTSLLAPFGMDGAHLFRR